MAGHGYARLLDGSESDMTNRFFIGAVPMSPRLMIIAGTASVLLGGLATSATSAGFVCKNGFQLVQGSWLSTPYCQDALVAQVAHEYGFKASASEVRNNPMVKQRLCRFIGQDIRIKETCSEVTPVPGRGFY